MKYSVLIPAYKMDKSLIRLLHALLTCKTSLIGEIHVYFDGSPAPESLPEHKNLFIHHGEINQGLVYARNFLIAQANCERVLFLDADTVPEPGFFVALDKLKDKSLFAGQESRGHTNNLWQKWRLRFFRQTMGLQPLAKAPSLCGLCFGGDKALIQNIGFNQTFRNHGEDVDFALRAIATKQDIYYEPLLAVFHDRQDNHKSLKTMMREHIRYQSLAYRLNRQNTTILLKNQIRLIPVSFYSSIRRAKSPLLAIISMYLGLLALMYRVRYLTCKI